MLFDRLSRSTGARIDRTDPKSPRSPPYPSFASVDHKGISQLHIAVDVHLAMEISWRLRPQMKTVDDSWGGREEERDDRTTKIMTFQPGQVKTRSRPAKNKMSLFSFPGNWACPGHSAAKTSRAVRSPGWLWESPASKTLSESTRSVSFELWTARTNDPDSPIPNERAWRSFAYDIHSEGGGLLLKGERSG